MLLAGLVACGGGAAAPTPTPAPSLRPSPSPSPPPPPLSPLTGEPVTDDEVFERPVLAVKIENSAAARPQSGLDEADIVFEELTEGGITRFLALFHSRVPAAIGPIRSGRPVDALVLPAYRPLLVMSGARPDVEDQLSRAGVEVHDEDDGVLYRDRSRSAPHDLYGAGPDLFEAAAERAPPAAVALRFDPEPPPGDVCSDDRTPAPGPSSTPALPAPSAAPSTAPTCPQGESISVRMSGPSTTGFAYDPPAGVYRREQNGQPHTVTGEGRIGAANVVVLGVHVADSGCCDPAGNPLTETDVVGDGRAVVLRDGLRYEARWVKRGARDHATLTLGGNQPMLLRPGPTWVLLAPAGNLPEA